MHPQSLLIRLFPLRGQNYNYNSYANQYVPYYDDGSSTSVPSFEVQSGQLEGAHLGIRSQTRAQTVSFHDGEEVPVYEQEGTNNPTSYIAVTPDTSLSEFFSRPVRIHAHDWEVGGSYDTELKTLNVWDLFLSNKRVSNRISNFAMMRARVHLKITVNGNGFYYGRVLASVHPYRALDQYFSNLKEQDMVAMTQMPHVFIDPTSSIGGEISVPYFHNTDYYRIGEDWADPTVGVNNKIVLTLALMNPLKHANGGTNPLTINVFMWLSDVEMSNITSVNSGFLVTQSGEEQDMAIKTGVVSGPATAIANVAKVLSEVPIIAPYARATDKIATITSNLAKCAGLSRPNILTNPIMVKESVTNLALANVPDLSQKLTLDSKNELSIDPTLLGIGPQDPMDIVSIAKKETYMGKFFWDIGATGLIWSTIVQPTVWLQDDVEGDGSYHLTATAAATFPFDYWGGTMRYRFQVVCSAHHRGRLKVIWDPNYLVDTTISENEFNVNYIKVVDIADTTDFTVDIGWGQATPLANHLRPGIDLSSDVQRVGSGTYGAAVRGNGVLGIQIMNKLTSPNDTVNNDVQVNVYVSAMDDLRVSNPNYEVASFGFTPQSGEENAKGPESTNDTELNMPLQDQSYHVGAIHSVPDMMFLNYCGENVTSLRLLLKRYCKWRTFPLTGTGNINYIRLPYYPFYRGSIGPDTSTTYPSGIGYVNTIWLHYVTSMFAACRGSIRYKFAAPTDGQPGFTSVQRVVTDELPLFETSTNATPPSSLFPKAGVTGYSLTNIGSDPYSSGYSGMVLNPINQVMEVEVPFYSKYRFAAARWRIWYTSNSPACPDLNAIEFRSRGYGSVGIANVYVAAGEDFQCYYFIGLPRMYRADVISN